MEKGILTPDNHIILDNYLEEYKPEAGIEHTGAPLFLLPQGDRTVLVKAIEKIGSVDAVYENEVKTVDNLIKGHDELAENDIVGPEKFGVIDSKIAAYTMEFLQGMNLKKLLQDPTVDIGVKVKYLKQIGSILRRMEKLREKPEFENFYLNDMHEGNFIIDDKTGTLKAIDLDSCRIKDNYPFAAKYLSSFSPIFALPYKYDRDFERSCGGEFQANRNSDLYCYAIIALHTIVGQKFNYNNVMVYQHALNKLLDAGANKELVDAFARVYQEGDNINFDYLLDSVPEFYGRIRTK